MGRLIDTDEYEKRIKPYDTEDVMDKALYNFAHEKLITTPTAQSEIIRCKDCMHNGSFDTDCPIDWNGKEYCSFAERKEDE